MIRKISAIPLVVLVSVLFVGCESNPQSTVTPTSVAKEAVAERISVWKANELVVSESGVLVDTRSAAQYEDHHAIGAILAPIQEISDRSGIPALENIPKDQNLILYCT